MTRFMDAGNNNLGPLLSIEERGCPQQPRYSQKRVNIIGKRVNIAPKARDSRFAQAWNTSVYALRHMV